MLGPEEGSGPCSTPCRLPGGPHSTGHLWVSQVPCLCLGLAPGDPLAPSPPVQLKIPHAAAAVFARRGAARL